MPPRTLNRSTQCQHRTKDRKQCQMPSAPPVAQTSVCVPLNSADSPSLPIAENFCTHHQRIHLNQIYQSARPTRRPEKDPAQIAAVATALLTNTNNLSDPAQVNQFLANLLNQLAHNKISRKNAIAMAYISQLLLNSISVKHKQDRDAQLAQQAADASKPTKIVIDMPRPQYDSSLGTCSGAPSGRHASDFRTGESSHSHSVDVPIAAPVSNRAPNNPPPPPTDDPPPSTHPKHVPLPRWGGPDPVTNYTYREPERPNSTGRPRMRGTRRQSCACLKPDRLVRRRPTANRDLPWVYLPSHRTKRGTITVSPRSSQIL